MGFLKFLKRGKKSDFDELDLPPAPPSLNEEDFGAGNFKESMPEFPDFPEEKISAPKEESFDFGRGMPEMGNEAMEFPELDAQEQPKAPVPMPAASVPVQQALPPKDVAPEQPRFTPLDEYPKIEKKLFSQEKRMLHERPLGKTIYVKVERFKAALGSINIVRSDLRKSEEALAKLESIKASKDRSFDKATASLDDLQKKLIFIDKTLFKED